MKKEPGKGALEGCADDIGFKVGIVRVLHAFTLVFGRAIESQRSIGVISLFQRNKLTDLLFQCSETQIYGG